VVPREMARPMGQWIAVLGWVGASLILIAYGLLSSGSIRPRSRVYQLMNILGSAGLIVNSGSSLQNFSTSGWKPRLVRSARNS
jgi:hypothetical protein